MWIRFLEEILDFLLILVSLNDEEIGPVDGPDPTNQVDGGEHLEDADEYLSFAPACSVGDA